ncbi:hypothetical protein NITMOv2_4219 [Nitrospira moscoviensis]|uniref:Uncharacterized protein n=1 Tax=Nitrospira moscoviensis TaxID=42253 RepID=A0A0K2GI00_NITMO|nr:hypothetical protein NITMOv2_4219 [Nitrospira moscoviensis]
MAAPSLSSMKTVCLPSSVKADRLIYDVQTTVRNHGRPVFNLREEVIGMGGTNFAGPIRFGHEALRGSA